MPMIQGIDGNALINAFRAGKQDRASEYERQAKQAETQAKLERERETRGLMGQLFGGSAPAGGGVAGAYGVGGSSSPAANVEGRIAPVTPAMAQEPPRATYDPNILQKLVMLDPEVGGKIAGALKTMDEMTIKRHQDMNDIMGAAAHYLAKVPQNERAQAMQIIAPQLKAAGWTDQQIAGADLSDRGLQGYQAVAIDYDKMFDNELAERKFQAGDNVAMQPGGGVANIRPTFGPDGSFAGNTAQVVIQPNTGESAVGASAGGIQEGATATNPRTGEKIQYRGGQWVPMGGGSGNATGGFRP